MQVKDFREGEHVSIKLLISSLVKGATNSGAPYLTLTLQDSSKAIDAKLWDVKPEIEKNLEVGKVYNFDLEVIKYKSNLQCKVISVLPVSQNDINYDDYVFRSSIPTSVLRDSIQNADLAQNLLVIKTIPGLASGVCSAIDNMKHEGLVGTIAGDDTAFIAFKDNDSAIKFYNLMEGML